jgi:hypothetical protein
LSTPPHLCAPQKDRAGIAKAKKSTRHQSVAGAFSTCARPPEAALAGL